MGLAVHYYHQLDDRVCIIQRVPIVFIVFRVTTCWKTWKCRGIWNMSAKCQGCC